MSFIDFSLVDQQRLTMLEFSKSFSLGDIKIATQASIDTLLSLVQDMDDQQVTFLPHDPAAHDPYAVPGEEHIGWSLAHLVVHVTASAEEWAAYSSILARGIVYPAEPRLRYETHWQSIMTTAQCVQRLEESRRIRLGYLATWPDRPHLNVYRELSPRFLEKFGPMNAVAAYLFGLKHEWAHFDQFREVRQQAIDMVAAVGK